MSPERGFRRSELDAGGDGCIAEQDLLGGGAIDSGMPSDDLEAEPVLHCDNPPRRLECRPREPERSSGCPRLEDVLVHVDLAVVEGRREDAESRAGSGEGVK